MTDYPTTHPQVTIRHDGYEAKVDEGIAELILELWRAGIHTVLSCQESAVPDEGQRVWIELAEVNDVDLFVEIAAGPPDEDIESIYNRAACEWTPSSPDDREHFLRYRTWHYRLSVDRNSDDDGGSFVLISAGVRFPVSDYATVLERFKAWNAGRNAIQPATRYEDEEALADLDLDPGFLPPRSSADAFTGEVRRQRLERERAER
jgi:hypothetical protein